LRLKGEGNVKRILRWARPVGLVAVLAVAVMAFAGGAGASGPSFSTSLTSTPSGVPVPYSTTDTSTYVQFVSTFHRTSTDTSALTHATINQPVVKVGSVNPTVGNAVFPGPIVSLTSSQPCTPTYRDSNTGVACDFGTLRADATITLTVVVQMPQKPASGDLPPFDALAALTVKEGGNDSQPQSNYTDTFFTNPLTTTLTSDTSAAFNTFTNPNTTNTQTFSTNKTLGNGNPQWTQASIPSPNGIAIGVLVHLAESPISSCPIAGTCFGQLSTIEIGQSAPKGGLFACVATNLADTNCLQFTVMVAGSTLTTSINASKVTIFHTFDLNGQTVTDPVPRCSTKTTDRSGDCIVSVTQNPKTKDITWIARGPGNGGWGGAG
jgi:hypothetical protein